MDFHVADRRCVSKTETEYSLVRHNARLGGLNFDVPVTTDEVGPLGLEVSSSCRSSCRGSCVTPGR
jgi:hypothetical protein